MLSSGVAMVGIRWAAWIGVLLVCAECWAQTATGAFTVYNCKSKSCQEIMLGQSLADAMGMPAGA